MKDKKALKWLRKHLRKQFQKDNLEINEALKNGEDVEILIDLGDGKKVSLCQIAAQLKIK